jgi:acetyl esterase/lipase
VLIPMKFCLAILLLACGPITNALAQTSTYYLPPGVSNIRAMIIGGTPLAGGTSQIWRDFALAQRVGLAQTLSDLPTIATATGHPEIANAPFVTCGTSAGASAAASIAIANPSRAIAVVGLHGVMFALGNDGFNANRSGENSDVPTLDFSAAYAVPMIHNFDNNDGFVNPVVLQGLVEYGRAQGALWAFFIHNDGNHTNNDTALTTLIFPWLAAVLDQRLPASAGTGNGTVTLNPLTEANGWLGNIKSGASASYASYSGDKAKAAWFPNQNVATIWSGYHFLPPYNIPPQPIVAPSGIIADLTILDPINNDVSSGTGWKINANLKEADQAGSLVKSFIMAPPPASVAGLDWIRPITPGKSYSVYTADPIFTFRVTADASVYIAHSDQASVRPAWLSTWANTGEQMIITSGNLNANAPRYTLFKKDFSANATVTCGVNGNAPAGSMYLTIVKPLGTPTLPSVSINASDATATEGADSGAFTVVRSGDTSAALSVNFSVAGSAISGSDYNALGTNVVIAPGASSAPLTVTPINDVEQEVTESVLVTLSADAAYNLGTPSSALLNLLDDDAPPLAVVTVADTVTTAAEPGISGQFTLSRIGATTNALTVNFNVSGSAGAGIDYVALGSSALIGAGQSSVTIAVTPLDDALVEDAETITLSIADSVTYALGTISTASVNIADNDSVAGAPSVSVSSSDTIAAEGGSNTASVTFTRTGATANALPLNLSYRGTAANGIDVMTVPASFSIPSGQSAATLTLSPINDTLVEGAENAVIALVPSASYVVTAQSFISVLINDNDNDNATPQVTAGIVFATHVSGANTRDVKLNVYLPATGTGPWPVLIYYPGGGWSVQTETSISALFTNLTASGYAVVSASYVSSSFAKWPAQIQDAKAAVRWVRANAASYGFDATRIAVSGGSSGGHMANYVGVSGGRSVVRVGNEAMDLVGNIGGNFEQSDAVQAVAPFFGPTDLLVMDHYPTPGLADHNAANSPESSLIGAAIQTVPEKTATANPIVLVRSGLPPFWITHGSNDALVDFNQSELLNAALVRAGQNVTFWPVQGGGHGPGVSDSQDVIGLMKAFLDRHLKGISANALPIAAFSASALSGAAPLTVTFDGSASIDADGVITQYSWANGDDTGADGATMTYTYARPGVYPVCLAVRDDQGGSASFTTNIVVNPAGTPSATPPTISLIGPNEGSVYSPTGDLLIHTNAAAVSPATLTSVEYFLNGQPIAWDSKAPYNTTLGGLPPGLYAASARVSDSAGAATQTAVVNFRVESCEVFCNGFEN